MITSICIAWFAIATSYPSYLPDFFHNYYVIIIVIIISGFTLNASIPIFYELGVEITYPIPEGTSAGLLTIMMNLVSLIFITIGDYIQPVYINMLYAGIIITCTIGILFCKEQHKRADIDR